MRLNEIEDEYGDDVSVEWQSFLLRPEPEPRTMEKFTAYTESWERPGGLEPRALFNQWSGVHQPPSHSVPPAVAGKVAAAQGKQAHRAFSDGMFAAYFTENRTISDSEVILSVATDAGLDLERFTADWNDKTEEMTKAVYTDYYSAVNSEITGVPAVVVNRTWLIPGAVDTDQYRTVIAEAQKQAAAEPNDGGATTE